MKKRYPLQSCSAIQQKKRWQRNGNGISIAIRGNVSAGLSTKVDEVIHRLRRIWRKLGALTLPGAALAEPGTDVHLAGLFPMGMHAPHGTSQNGELIAAPGVFAVDGSVLPTLPSKYVTLTIMANADRIGRHIARRQQTN